MQSQNKSEIRLTLRISTQTRKQASSPAQLATRILIEINNQQSHPLLQQKTFSSQKFISSTQIERASILNTLIFVSQGILEVSNDLSFSEQRTNSKHNRSQIHRNTAALNPMALPTFCQDDFSSSKVLLIRYLFSFIKNQFHQTPNSCG